MPKARLELDLDSRGATLRAIGREFRQMDNAKLTGIFKKALEDAARPYPERVAAAARAIPVKDAEGGTGLRERIARCATSTSWTTGREAGVSVWMDTRRMEPDYRTLPLYMEGVVGPRGRDYRRWRHPVYGNREVWRSQAAHPYFGKAVEGLGRDAGEKMRAALEDVIRQVNG